MSILYLVMIHLLWLQIIKRLIEEGADIFQKDIGGIAATDLVPSRDVLLLMHDTVKQKKRRKREERQRRRQKREAMEQQQVADESGMGDFEEEISLANTATTSTIDPARDRPNQEAEGENESESESDSEEPVNLREPANRLVDYVAVLAFDPGSKQSTVCFLIA